MARPTLTPAVLLMAFAISGAMIRADAADVGDFCFIDEMCTGGGPPVCVYCDMSGAQNVCQYRAAGTPCPNGQDGVCNGQGLCILNGGVTSDPVINGFNGRVFHFAEVGDFSLLEEAEGWKVNAGFDPVSFKLGEDIRESSWTTSVRVVSPTGDMINCAIPAIRPNTSTVQMTAVAAANPSSLIELSTASQAVEFTQMSATPVVKGSAVLGCHISTAKFEVNVTQVYGWEEAALRPELDGWAAPFTWLNMNFKIVKPLALPVTGILGDTYPNDAAVETAGMVGDVPEGQLHMKHGTRILATANGATFSLSAGIAVGI